MTEVVRVMVSCTARSGGGARRVPDRSDPYGPISAYQVESAEEAAELLPRLDAPNCIVYVDVERKREVDLMAMAIRHLHKATIVAHKPNDMTVDAADATILAHFGPDLSGLHCGIVGTGNLGFKIGLRLAERNAQVELTGRNAAKVDQAISAMNMILPSSAPRPVKAWSAAPLDVLLSAVAAKDAIVATMTSKLKREALLIDAGIENFSANFLQSAHAIDCQILRLDVRAARLNLAPEYTFFDDVFGRSEVAGITVVAGGIIGKVGEIVIDRRRNPTRVVGVANGSGGLRPQSEWTDENREEVERIDGLLRERQTGL